MLREATGWTPPVGKDGFSLRMGESVGNAPQGTTNLEGLSEIDNAGLGLVDFHFWPHFNSDSVTRDQLRLSSTIPDLYACPDGAGIVIDGNECCRSQFLLTVATDTANG